MANVALHVLTPSTCEAAQEMSGVSWRNTRFNKGDFMSKLTLDYPVYSLDRHLLLPAGTALSEEDWHALISSGIADYRKKIPLMHFGTVKKDILDFVRQPPGNAVFSIEEKRIRISPGHKSE